jgi:hypothetical protein
MSRRLNKFSVAALLLLGVFLYSCAVGPDFQDSIFKEKLNEVIMLVAVFN